MNCLCLTFGICLVGLVSAKLELVHVFFRHGSRTPEEKDAYPNDPYTVKDFEPMGWGQLTNEGKVIAYDLGKLLRKRYDAFLGDIYTSEVASTVSTDYDRTKMTALLVLAGLFPPAPSQRWHQDLHWNPIPYTMDRTDYDYFIRRPLAYCPAYAEELRKVMDSDIASRILKENKKVLEYIEENAGKPVRSLMHVFQMYQTLSAEQRMNLTLPEWSRTVFPDVIYDLAGKQCYLENYNAVLKKLNGGRILGKVIENMKRKTDGDSPGRKINLYSGHENNVVNILAALNLFEPHVPRYGAAVIIELHDLDDPAVKVFYVRDVSTAPEELTVEGCESPCPFDKFVDITRPHVPLNYTAECGSRINLG